MRQLLKLVKTYKLIYVLIIANSICYAQEEYKISGFVFDYNNNKKLVGANIFNTINQNGSITDLNGYYNIDAIKGENTLIISHIGYKTDTLILNIKSNFVYNFNLKPTTTKLKEIQLINKNFNIENTQNSTIHLDNKDLKNIPGLLGEKDILKSIQLLPGVQSGNEGSIGFYVRGGGPDQNLILLDGVSLYNSSHLLGLFSVFNDDIIESINLTKGGFPARYGGRLSSILEVNTKDGDFNKWTVNGGIGLMSGKITIQGPINKKTAIIVSARRTWIDLLGQTLIDVIGGGDFNSNNQQDQTNGHYFFYDLNTKISHILSKKDKLHINVYAGKDDFLGQVSEENTMEISKDVKTPYLSTFQGNTDFGLSWNNFTTSIKWEHLINSKAIINTTGFYTSYNFQNTINSNTTRIKTFTNNPSNNETTNNVRNYIYSSGIEDLGLSIVLDYNIHPKHYLKLGAIHTKHNFLPGYQNVYENYDVIHEDNNTLTDTTIVFLQNTKPLNTSIFFEDTYSINNQISANIGIHYNIYTINQKLYPSYQPRISLRYLINETSSIKLSYAYMHQTIHLLTNSSFGLPNDIWVPSTEKVNPQQSKQIAFGYYLNIQDGQIGELLDFKKHNFEISIESYFKNMSNLITFSEGTNIFGTNFSNWEDRIENNGTGSSKGIEFFIKKNTGKTTGWIGYTLSQTTRQFPSINLGREYPYKFDRRHDLSFVCSYSIKKNIILSTTFVYGSGNFINMPVSQYLIPHEEYGLVTMLDYESKNSYQMEAYHRFDISCSFIKKKKWGERTWTLSIYNVYNRQNPFFFYLKEEDVMENDLQFTKFTPTQMSLFPIIPSIRYNFKF